MDIPHRTPAWFALLRQQAGDLLIHFGRSPDSLGLFTTHVDEGKSHRTAWVERYGVEWLDQQIHFANWNAAQIAKMPTTHITEWLTANNMDYSMSKGYDHEDREGGLNALGSGIPGIAHDQLNVLTSAEWLKMEDQLTYESWAAKTLEAERESVGLSRLELPRIQ